MTFFDRRFRLTTGFLGALSTPLILLGCATATKQAIAPAPVAVVVPATVTPPIPTPAPKHKVSSAAATTPRPAHVAPAIVEAGLDDSEVGYYMDVLEARVHQVCGARVHIQRQGTAIALRFAAPARAPAEVAVLTAGIVDVLAPLAGVLNEYRRTQVVIQVYADDVVSPVMTQSTAQQRTEAIMKYLVDAGVARSRLWAEPWTGSTRSPVTPGAERGTDVAVRLAPLARAVAAQKR
jgi:outer membrane protein OmpA-like peptidoglycan-associated protein